MKVLVVDPTALDLVRLRKSIEGSGDVIVSTTEKDPALLWSSLCEGVDAVVIARRSWTSDDGALCARVSARGRPVPLLALGEENDERQRSLALRAGADDFIGTALDDPNLAANISTAARRVASRFARTGAFSVDFRRRKVFVDDQPLVLTPREYDLLVVLVERGGEVVSRDDLAERLNGPGHERSKSNVVEVHVSRVRAKLGASASRLEAVRGRGYRLR